MKYSHIRKQTLSVYLRYTNDPLFSTSRDCVRFYVHACKHSTYTPHYYYTRTRETSVIHKCRVLVRGLRVKSSKRLFIARTYSDINVISLYTYRLREGIPEQMEVGYTLYRINGVRIITRVYGNVYYTRYTLLYKQYVADSIIQP